MIDVIPKATLVLDKEAEGVKWDCPGCGQLNWLIACDPDLKSMRAIDNVECDGCCRKYETR